MHLPSPAVEQTPSQAPDAATNSSRRSGYVIAAWTLAAICLALLLGTIALIVLSTVALAGAGPLQLAYTYTTNGTNLLVVDIVGYALHFVALLAFVAIGALVVARFPTHPIGWILATLGLVGMAEEFATYYAIYGLIARPGALPGGLLAAWVTEWIWTIFFGLLNVFLPLLFPTGHSLSPRWRPVGWFAGCACVLLTLSFMLKPGLLGNRTRLMGIESPVTLFAPGGLIEPIVTVAFGSVLLSMLLAAVSLVARLRRARGDERQQLKWFCYPAALLAILFVFQGLFQHGLGLWPAALGIGYRLTWTLVFTMLPIAVGIAILKYRLYDIDLVINRTLVYGALSASVVGIYVLIVGALGALFQARGDMVVSLIATALVALLFQPLRERLQRSVNRLMYGERDEPYAVISRLGRRLEATLAPNAVLPTIVETVRDALRLPYVAIALATVDQRPTTNDEPGRHAFEDAFEIAAAAGTQVDDLLRIPLVYQAETVGTLLLGLRAPGEAFSLADRKLLDDLARQAGVAAHAVRLATDLQRSRERLVTAREEERRRLRRDLHDGLGPQLATQTLKLEAARDLIASDPTRASHLLSGLIVESQTALADIRRLVYALRPPALDELGLVGTLREQAAQYQHTGGRGGATLRIVVDAPEYLPALPAAVEVAVYRIALEALNNVVKHADARTCLISLGVANGLHLDIRDDGRGLPPDRRAGVGMSSMRERAAELGGRCTIGPAPGGGTAVVAWLPLP
jgi:two-component system, NarL family, sensor kinase